MPHNLMAQMIKYLPAMQEIQFPSLGWENPLKKGKATHSSILVWRIPWTREPMSRYKESDTTGWLSLSLSPLWTGWSFNFLACLKGSLQWSSNLPFSNLLVGDLHKLFTHLHKTIYQYLKKSTSCRSQPHTIPPSLRFCLSFKIQFSVMSP